LVVPNNFQEFETRLKAPLSKLIRETMDHILQTDDDFPDKFYEAWAKAGLSLRPGIDQ
jgi:hypothetical protein